MIKISIRMDKKMFISLIQDPYKNKIIINTDYIVAITENEDKTAKIDCGGIDQYFVTESYDSLVEKIQNLSKE
jgi:hypothetical protein